MMLGSGEWSMVSGQIFTCSLCTQSGRANPRLLTPNP